MSTEVSPERIETKKYALQMSGLDFGILNARNQLIIKALNPLLDEIMPELKHDHITGSETKYTLKILLVSEREVELQ